MSTKKLVQPQVLAPGGSYTRDIKKPARLNQNSRRLKPQPKIKVAIMRRAKFEKIVKSG